MTKGETITIGLLVEDLSTDYTQDIVRTIYRAIPEDRDIRLITIAGKMDDGREQNQALHEHRVIYNSVFNLSWACRFDGLIIALGALREMEEVELLEFLGRFSDIPRVFISASIPNETVVKYDNESGIREAVDMLVNLGGLGRIVMLGGREDNFDAVERREILKRCLKERGLELPEHGHINTDMSVNCTEEAGKLLDDNPDAEAVFCVNDSVAKALYTVLKKRGLVPGIDIMVFGFDNTRMAGEMSPPLSSIGPKEMTVGKKALEMVVNKIDGKEVLSEQVSTKIYMRASMDYEIWDLSSMDVIGMDRPAIDRLFDTCFYRYRTDTYRRTDVNLKRLFGEIVDRMIKAVKSRYLSPEEFRDICDMIDVFIDNGAMDYTDTQRLMRSLGLMQATINVAQKSVAANVLINRLFLRFKDRMIYITSGEKEKVIRQTAEERERMRQFLSARSATEEKSGDPTEISIRMLEKIGVTNMLFYMYTEPQTYGGDKQKYPDTINLKCMIRDGQLYMISKSKQKGSVRDMFIREEVPAVGMGYITFPVFCEKQIFGLLACEISGKMYDMGELIAAELGRALYMDHIIHGQRT